LKYGLAGTSSSSQEKFLFPSVSSNKWNSGHLFFLETERLGSLSVAFLKKLIVEKKLSNEKFVQNAKLEVVEMEKKKLHDALQKIALLKESIANLS
jgi:hypothetical protein